MTDFNPIMPAIGGALIGLGVSAMMFFNGRIAGISGIYGGMLSPARKDTAWRMMFILGLIVGGAVMVILRPEMFSVTIDRSTLAVVGAGLLVGFGTRLGSGCTSGHGVCGISRLSPRSVAATMTFMLTGAVTVYAVNHIFGGAV